MCEFRGGKRDSKIHLEFNDKKGLISRPLPLNNNLWFQSEIFWLDTHLMDRVDYGKVFCPVSLLLHANIHDIVFF